MVAAYWQLSSDGTINGLLALSYSLLAALGTLQCVCLQSATQQKPHVHTYIYTVQSGNGNCVCSATAVESGVGLNAVQPSGHYIYC